MTFEMIEKFNLDRVQQAEETWSTPFVPKDFTRASTTHDAEEAE